MTTCASLQCANCPQPGRCCCGFGIDVPATREARHPLEIYAWLASVTHPDPAMGNIGLPFLPLRRGASDDEMAAGMRARWQFWCPRLGRDGRCTDYEGRPELCRTYKPASDGLCALHSPRPYYLPDEVKPMNPNHDLALLAAQLGAAMHGESEERHLNVRQLAILLDIRLNRSATTTTGDIAQRIRVGRSVVTRALRQLEAAGLITNTRRATPGEDRRLNEVALTAQGTELLMSIASATPPVEEVKAIDPEEAIAA
jgi:DNA-binding MarR family transcriptional regulator/Fe-S-cluster containining protein